MKQIDIVCIVDDDPIHVFTTKRALQLENVCKSIMVFKDGKEAFDRLRAIHTSSDLLPDVILLDLNMPIWDGWDFLDEFTKIQTPKQIKIYITSSSESPEDLAKAKTYEAVSSFIVKPLTVEKLKSELSKADE